MSFGTEHLAELTVELMITPGAKYLTGHQNPDGLPGFDSTCNEITMTIRTLKKLFQTIPSGH